MDIDFDIIRKKEEELQNSDIIEILKIRDELKKYNMIDFLEKVSSLMLFPINQSKSVIFQCIISTALSIPENEMNKNNIMSSGKFRKIINEFSNLHRIVMVDPPEFPFALPVIYYRNYHIFMGENSLSPLNLNILLKSFMINRERIGEKLFLKINRIVRGFLELSEHIYIKSKIDFTKLQSYDKDEDIFIPNADDLNRYSMYIEFSKEYIERIFGEEIERFKCNFGDIKTNEIDDFNNQVFYDRPFIIAENKYIILDITTIISLLMKIIIELIEEYSNIDIISEYNVNLKMQIDESFGRLGNLKIDPRQFGIELIENKSYIETLYSSGNDGIIINIDLFDTGKNFADKNNFIIQLPKDFISRRIEAIKNKLLEFKVDDYKITTVITPTTLGRNMYYSIENCKMQDIITLSPYEIESISINESEQNMFLQRYLIARKKLKFFEKTEFSELNTIVLYIKNDYSFYVNDEVDVKEAIFAFIGEYSADYILKAYIKEQKHLCLGIEKNTMLEVIKLDGNIFFSPSLFIVKILNQVYENDNFILWAISDGLKNEEMFDIYKNFIELIMFWLDKMSILLQSKNGFFILNVEAKGSYLDFLRKEDNEQQDINDLISYKNENNKFTIYLTPELFHFFDYENNLHEKQFMKCLLSIINIDIDEDRFSQIFENKYMKKTISIDSVEEAYMVPLQNKDEIKISHSDENLILDEIGTYLLNDLDIKYGKIEDSKIMNRVVEYLYNKLINYIKIFDKEQLLKCLYFNYEGVISNLHIRQEYYSNDITCYPEHEKEIKENYNELNKISVALKFLIELESSLKTLEVKKISQYDNEFMIGIASQIIEWAYIGDLVYYHMMNSPIELLNSNRIGFDHEILNKSSLAMYSAREERLSAGGKEKIQELNKYKTIPNGISDIEFEEAFKSEFEFSFDEYKEVILFLIEYAEEQDFLNNICEISINMLIERLENKVDKEVILKILDKLSLQERDDFLNPPNPYKKEDVYPWRFNREMSLTRRPLIIYNGNIIYGYRNLCNSIMFLLDLIQTCKIKATSQKMKNYISKLENIKGQAFNDLVYNYISDYKEFIIDKNVEKVNSKKITGEDNNVLGDIDILCISEEKGIISVIETKDFYLAKNFYEIYNEYKKMFDISNNKSFYNKHMKRVEWVKSHIDDIKMQYKLSDKKWKVTYLFIVDDNLISKDVFELNIRISTLRNLDKDILLNS